MAFNSVAFALPDGLERDQPAVFELATMWQRHRVRGRLPTSSDLPETAFERWKRNLCLYQVVGDGADFLLAFEGDTLLTLTGESWVGHFASEIEAKYRRSLLYDLRYVFYKQEPLFTEERIFQTDFVPIHRIILPIGDQRGVVIRLMLAMYPVPPAAQKAPPPLLAMAARMMPGVTPIEM